MLLGKDIVVHNRGYSAIVGIILVVAGTLTTVLSYIRYRRTESHLEEGRYTHSSLLVTIITALIFLISVILIAYLVATT